MSEEKAMGDDNFVAGLSQAKPAAEQPQTEETPYEVVDSSQIHSMRREPNGTVGIRFKDRKTGGFSSEYHYQNIPEALYEQMRAADSIGNFFGENIRNNPKAYPFRKIEQKKESAE